MYIRWITSILLTICFLLQIRNFNTYLVNHRRKNTEARTYLNSDVCTDPITRAQLGTFNLCVKAEHIVNEQPSSAAFYDILNDWYPCGHGRCEGILDWFWSNAHWFLIGIGAFGMMIYFKWVDHQRDILFTKMRLPTLTHKNHHID